MKTYVSKKQLRKFGLLIGLGFPVFIGWILPLISGHVFKSWTLLIGLPLLILAIINPNLLIYPFKGWMLLGHILGYVNSKLILGLVFICVLQPIALLLKFSGYDPLRQKKMLTNTYKEIKKEYRIDLTRIF